MGLARPSYRSTKGPFDVVELTCLILVEAHPPVVNRALRRPVAEAWRHALGHVAACHKGAQGYAAITEEKVHPKIVINGCANVDEGNGVPHGA